VASTSLRARDSAKPEANQSLRPVDRVNILMLHLQRRNVYSGSGDTDLDVDASSRKARHLHDYCKFSGVQLPWAHRLEVCVPSQKLLELPPEHRRFFLCLQKLQLMGMGQP
jgi:hypothetical protein